MRTNGHSQKLQRSKEYCTYSQTEHGIKKNKLKQKEASAIVSVPGSPNPCISVACQRPHLILITTQRFYLNSITLESLISKCIFWRTHSIFFPKLIALQERVNCNSLYVYWYIYCAVMCYLNSGHESVRCVLNEDFKCIFEDYIFEYFKWWYTNIGNWGISLNNFTSSSEPYD